MNTFRSADILLPKDADMSKWAVIACDQFTSDPDYWARVDACAADAPSTLRMILPEAYLGGEQEADMVAKINETMLQYLEDGVFRVLENSYVYVERTLQDGFVRPGVLGVVDLEQYDYNHGSQSLIRATEKTVLERIPPRQRVRKDAALEFPHVLMLCDDEKRCLIESVTAIRDRLPKLYDFDLMEQGGHITGWLLSGEDAAEFDRRFAAFAGTVGEKYRDLSGAPALLAVGDGNHSLATAKNCYEVMKEQNPGVNLSNHPARFALVELENIHDDSLVFEPIHRILTGVDGEKLLRDLESICAPDGFPVHWAMGEESGTLYLDRNRGELAVAILQPCLDAWLAENPGQIDYIHGDEETCSLARQDNAVGLLLPAMEKHQLFRGIVSGGVLPRKTFSMGHAREKRYYLEGRKIR